MMNNNNEDNKSYVCGGEGVAGMGDVGVGVACSLRNFYDTWDRTFISFVQ